MIAGWSSFQTLVRNHPEIAFFAHPTMGGAARIAPDLLIGKLFRLLGADAVIFPNHGGRFGYTPETCRRLAAQARTPSRRHPSQRPRPRRRHDASNASPRCLTSTDPTRCC